MITRVIKRDGREAVFNIEKIANAIDKALDASAEVTTRDQNRTRSQISLDLSTLVAEAIERHGENRPTIEQIQDTVEQVLMENGYPETAKRYIIYRAERSRVREMKTHLMQTFHAMNPLVQAEREAIRKAAATASIAAATDSLPVAATASIPVASSAEGELQPGQIVRPDEPRHAAEHLLQYGLTGAQSYNLLYLLRQEVSQAHQNHDIDLQDLAYYLLTFADYPLDLRRLLTPRREPDPIGLDTSGDIRSDTQLASVAIAQIQAETSGILTLVQLDRAMAGGVTATREQLSAEYDAIRSSLLPSPPADSDPAWFSQQIAQMIETVTERLTYQAMASLVQARPLSGSSVHAAVAQAMTTHATPARLSFQFGLETDHAARLVSRQLIQAIQDDNRTGQQADRFDGPVDISRPGLSGSTRPAAVFLLASGVNFQSGDPNFDLFQSALTCCALTGSPAFAFGETAARSICTVTLNLPRCAILARNDLNLFYHRLDSQVDLAINALLERLAVLQSIRRQNFPLIASLADLDSDSNQPSGFTAADLLLGSCLQLSFVGLAETLTSLVGRHHGQRQESARLGLEIVSRLREHCLQASEMYGQTFHLHAGQDRWVSRTFARSDRQHFGRIAGVTDGTAYTAGFCLPERLAIPPYERIRIEAPYHQLVDCGQCLTLPLPEQSAEPVDSAALADSTPHTLETWLRAAELAGIKRVEFSRSTASGVTR